MRRQHAGSILGQVKAEKLGYSQVLWLDGEHRKYVEEVGTMNIMFKIAGDLHSTDRGYGASGRYQRFHDPSVERLGLQGKRDQIIRR